MDVGSLTTLTYLPAYSVVADAAAAAAVVDCLRCDSGFILMNDDALASRDARYEIAKCRPGLE